jgi:hypothetical protein
MAKRNRKTLRINTHQRRAPRLRLTGSNDHNHASTRSVAVVVKRMDSNSGTAVAAGGIPVARGVVTDALLASKKIQLVLDLGAGLVEQAIFCTGLGRYADGSYRTVYIEVDPGVNLAVQRTGELRIGTLRTTTDRARTYSGFRNGSNLPTVGTNAAAIPLLGMPTAVCLASDPAYICSTGAFGRLVPKTTQLGLSRVAAQVSTYWSRFDTWLRDFHWDGAASDATLLRHTGNANLSGTDLTNVSNVEDNFNTNYQWSADPARPPAYYNWRTAIGISGFAGGQNYYDAAQIFFQAWAQTGNLEYFRRACVIGWANAYYYRYVYNVTNSNTNPDTVAITPWSAQAGAYQPEGWGLHYLLTGDPDSLEGLQGTALREVGHTGLGSWTDYWGEPRPMARIALARLWAWKCSRPGAELADWAATLEDAITRITTGTAWNHDGAGKYYWNGQSTVDCQPNTENANGANMFMQPICCDALTKIYDSFETLSAPNRTLVLDRVQKWLDWVYPNQYIGNPSLVSGWGGTTPSFPYEVSTCYPSVAGWGPTPDLSNLYPTVFAWYAKVSGNGVYRSIAERIFQYGVGTAVDGVDGPFLSGQKQSREQYALNFPTFEAFTNGPAITTIPSDAIASIVVTPSVASGSPTLQAQLTATARMSNGLPVSTTYTWASTNEAVATVNSNGLVTFVAEGTAGITASSGGVTSNACTITVAQVQFRDDFSTLTVEANNWDVVSANNGGTYSAATGALVLTAPSGVSSLVRLRMKNACDLVLADADGVEVQVVSATHNFTLLLTDAAGNGYGFDENGGTLGFGLVSGGTYTGNQSQISYNSSTQQKFRFRTNNTSLFYESHNGSTWTTHRTIALTGGVTHTAMKLALSTTNGGSSPARVATFDNVVFGGLVIPADFFGNNYFGLPFFGVQYW